jgi:prepilin-type N-terminal cleavage/methylation domain-containing protein
MDRHSARLQAGFTLIELMAALVVILGLYFAANYYRNRPADDPKAIDATLPDFATVQSLSAATDYYLEGTIRRVQRNSRGAYFTVRTESGREFAVVGTNGLSGGLAYLAPGQVGAMQVRMNTGPTLQASAMVVSLSQPTHAFVYKYIVKTPAPDNYVDPDDRR